MIEINRILCPIDFSPFSKRALRYAMQLAVWFGAKLQVLYVMPLMPPSTVSELSARQRQRSALQLRAIIEECRLPDADVAAELVESSEVAERILDSAGRFDADLIVTGSHGRSGMQRVILGSVVESLLHRTTRPILTVPSHAETLDAAPLARILCAVDFSEASLSAAAVAIAIAEEADAELSLLHVLETRPELSPAASGDLDAAMMHVEAEATCRRRLEAFVPEHARDYCTVHSVAVEGDAARQILHVAETAHANLIVMGVHGRSAFDLAFFGSNSKDVIRKARCPVLIVPGSRKHAALRPAS